MSPQCSSWNKTILSFDAAWSPVPFFLAIVKLADRVYKPKITCIKGTNQSGVINFAEKLWKTLKPSLLLGSHFETRIPCLPCLGSSRKPVSARKQRLYYDRVRHCILQVHFYKFHMKIPLSKGIWSNKKETFLREIVKLFAPERISFHVSCLSSSCSSFSSSVLDHLPARSLPFRKGRQRLLLRSGYLPSTSNQAHLGAIVSAWSNARTMSVIRARHVSISFLTCVFSLCVLVEIWWITFPWLDRSEF